MATKVAKSIGVAVGLVVVLFLVAGRRIGELSGYARATADTTVDGLTDSLPQEIRDRKIDRDIKAARLDLIDRQVQLNLSQGQIQQLQKDVEQLQASVGRRQRLLSEAYPVLKRAVAKKEADVQFAGTKFTLRDFQREVDDLMSQQDRETRQLKIKQDGLARLEKSVADGDRAISEMRSAMESSEQEVAVLKARRQQAEVESTTLDMIASVTANGQST
ncbi:MAG TPA: hypothetical protein PLV92_30205, partial [Pirellulaceae bacterium]|nr:hypothetical protein [Pirellulaceae bacterium]